MSWLLVGWTKGAEQPAGHGSERREIEETSAAPRGCAPVAGSLAQIARLAAQVVSLARCERAAALARSAVMRALAPCLAALALSSCGPTAPSEDAGADAPLAEDDAFVAASDAGRDAGPPSPPAASGVFPDHRRTALDWDRPDQGEVVPATDVDRATDQLLDLLARTDWLDFVAERAHGWPESDPEGRYWYATWWSGVTVRKSGGAITYVHSPDGADNNGLRTAQLLEGACYAYRLWGDPRDRLLVRRLVRGFSSWSMAMERTSDDERGLLSRAAYPASVEDTARAISIDYAADRPGEPGPPSYYVHLTDNPHWPDLYVKNIRSKDDMGHMLRAVALLDTCAGQLGDAEAEAELVEMRRLYQEWAQRVERDGFRIASRTEAGEPFQPEGDLATYFLGAGVECAAGYAIPLMSRFDTLGYTCRNPGLGPVSDPAGGVPSGALQILRTHHEAAAALALASGRDETARADRGARLTHGGHPRRVRHGHAARERARGRRRAAHPRVRGSRCAAHVARGALPPRAPRRSGRGLRHERTGVARARRERARR